MSVSQWEILSQGPDSGFPHVLTPSRFVRNYFSILIEDGKNFPNSRQITQVLNTQTLKSMEISQVTPNDR